MLISGGVGIFVAGGGTGIFVVSFVGFPDTGGWVATVGEKVGISGKGGSVPSVGKGVRGARVGVVGRIGRTVGGRVWPVPSPWAMITLIEPRAVVVKSGIFMVTNIN